MLTMIRELPVRTILILSVGFGSLIGTMSTLADDGIGTENQLYCRTDHAGCTITGCRYTSNLPDSFQVCTYTGSNCPPLTQCEA